MSRASRRSAEPDGPSPSRKIGADSAELSTSGGGGATGGDRFERLPWDDLQFFLALARRQTLGRAAQSFGVSHTTVLRRIANLERRVAQKLFDRTSEGFMLNEQGWELLELAESMERVAETIFHPSRDAEQPEGSVRIACVEGLGATIVTPALADLRREYPRIELELVTVMRTANLTKREADISLGLTRPVGPRNISHRLARCGVHLYASRGYVEEHGAPVRLDDMNHHSFVDYVEDMVEIQALKWFRDAVGERTVVMRSTSPLVQIQAVRADMGIGMFPDYLAGHDPMLHVILPQEVEAEREIWLAIHSDLRKIPRMAAVFNFLKTVLPSDKGFFS